jgi:hypothetical protein
VILDGNAIDLCEPARGGRFNSAVRYVHNTPTARMAIVVSDDRTLDVIPLLRPRVSAAKIEEALVALSKATLDDYHGPRAFLDDHRFYLNAEQCERANAALDRVEKMPRGTGEIVIITTRFAPNPAMDPSYLS